MQPKQKHDPPNHLFSSLSFLLLTDGLNEQDIELISLNILQNGGQIETISFANKAIRKIKVDYLICDPQFNQEYIRQSLPSSVMSQQCLDISYVQACIQTHKILPIANYKLKSQPSSKLYGSQPRKRTKLDANQQNLQNPKNSKAIKSSPDISNNNKFIIDQLNKLLKVYTNTGDKGRKIAYSRAISTIKSLNFQLSTEADVNRLKSTQNYISDKIADKIKQLLSTGSLTKLQTLKNTQQNLALQQITRIWGIGAVKAKQLYSKGIKTIQQLQKYSQQHPDILTKNQKIGLKYVQQLQIRIPRKKIAYMAQLVTNHLYAIVGNKNLHTVQVCGSYRRGKPTCGDMDVFITRKDGQYQKMLLTKLIQKLTEIGFLTDHLTMPRHLDSRSCQSYMGICKYQSQLHHRVDIKYYPSQQFAFAILYFTGSDMFNRKMRSQAIEKGYRLSDHGMYKINKHNSGNNDKQISIQCKNQQQIFTALGLEYQQPKDRDL